jgi:tetratricopeptide (TPR) repeat protein
MPPTFLAAFAFVLPAFAQAPKATTPDKAEEKSIDAPGAALRKRVERLLNQGKIEDALKAASEAVLNRGTAGERQEYVDLHMSLARYFLRLEDYRRAEEFAGKVSTVEANNPDAAGVLREIDRARAAAPAMVERAGQFRAVERYGAAARIYRKAMALLPEREGEWKAPWVECCAEAGDQNYRLGNWPEAMFHYDSAGGALDDLRRVRHATAILFHSSALLRQGRIAPPVWGEYVKSATAALQKQPDKTAATILIGLDHENAGRFDEAASAYAAAAGEQRPAPGGGQAEAARRRAAALEVLRKSAPRVTADGRAKMWQESLAGERLVRETERFRIYHHNDRIARRVADALEFYLVEIINDWRLPVDKVAGWKPKIDVHLYRNDVEFREKTGMAGFVPGFSKKPKPGAPLIEHSIHTYQNHPGLLSSILPHELTHLVLAHVAGYPKMPTALDEALALAGEPDYMRSAYLRAAFEPAVRANTPDLRTLLDEPKAGSGFEYTVFYARGLVLAELMRSRVSPDRIVAMLSKLPAGGDIRPVLAAALGFKDVGDLENGWRAVWAR